MGDIFSDFSFICAIHFRNNYSTISSALCLGCRSLRRRTDFERLVVDEPLDLHAVVTDRLQATLQVHVGALNRLNVTERLGECWNLWRRRC